MAGRFDLKDPQTRGLAVLVLAGLLLVALLWPLLVSRDARHLTAYASGDEDLSRFHGELELTGARVRSILGTTHLLDDVDEPDKTLLVVVGNERRYDPGEAQAVVDFLAAGGSVILADETGFGTDVARAAGLAFTSQRVLDTQNYRGDPTLVVATAAMDGTTYRLVFNSPASVVALSNALPHEVVAKTSVPRYPEGSFLDANANGEIDIADQAGPFPLVVRTQVGAGTLVLVSDTGLFMNAQLGLADYDNARFLRALVASLTTSGATVLLDESRHAPVAWIAPYENAVRTLGRATSGDVAPYVLVALAIALTLLAYRLTRATEDWSHHRHDVGAPLPLPDTVRGDWARAQRMARRAVSEKYNMSMEQVSAMTTEDLQAMGVEKTLADAASGALRSDPSALFRTFSTPRETTTESTP